VICYFSGLGEYSLLLQNKEKWFVLLINNDMEFNTTIDIILKDLRDVREILDDLRNYPGLPQLQVELAKSKCRSAEEIIALLKLHRPSEPEIVTKQAEKETVTIKAEKETVTKQPEKETVTNIKIEPSHSEHIAPPTEKKISSNIIADRFTGSSDTILDKFGSIRKDEDFSSSIRTKPVEDLTDAIGLNDKFLFIREIFGGSQNEYEKALGKLNRAESLTDAKAIIMSYSGDSEESDVVQQLLEIVKRKLPSDG
jgi:hypothetical protein